jgi:DNA-binding NarL/FixJ family response regulator
MSPVRLGIVEQQRLVCHSLQALFAGKAEFIVEWTAVSAADALDHWTKNPPDVVLLDGELRNGSPYDLAHRMLSGPSSSKVIILASEVRDDSVKLATDLKISGYLLKGDSPEAVIAGIIEAHSGRTSWSPAVERRLRLDTAPETISAPHQGLCQRLTARQIEIVRHLAQGSSAKEIGRELHLSEKSVSSHTYRIMKRLNIHDRVGLVRLAIRDGLVTV